MQKIREESEDRPDSDDHKPDGLPNGTAGAPRIQGGDAPRVGGTGEGLSPQTTPNNNLEEEEEKYEETISFRTLFLQNWIYVVTYCIVFWSFGMGVAFLGPTLLDLGCQTATDLKGMSWVFFIQLFFTSIGSIAAGCLSDRCPNHIMLLGSTLGIPFMYFLIPTCSSIATLGITLAIMGWCMGCVDCIANLRMVALFGRKVGPFLQAMHFFYGFGAFVSPLIAEPFLLNIDCTDYIDGATTFMPVNEIQNVTMNGTGLWSEGTTAAMGMSPGNTIAMDLPPQPYELLQAKMDTQIRYAFYIMGAIQLPIPVLVILLIFVERYRGFTGLQYNAEIGRTNQNSTSSSTKMPYFDSYGTIAHTGNILKTEEGSPSLWSRCFVCETTQILVITLLVTFIMFLYDGVQSSYGGFVYSYALKSVVGLDKSEGAYLNACFWGLFAFGRLLSIPLAARLTSAFMLLVNILGCGISIGFILILRHDHIMLYLGTCSLGLFLSSTSPTAMSLAEQFIHIKSSIMACLVVGAALGEMIFPVIVGNLFVNVGPVSFLTFCFSVILLSLLVYTALWMNGSKTEKWRALDHDSFTWLPGFHGGKRAGESTLVDKSSVKFYSRFEDEEDTDKYEMASLQQNNQNHSSR